MSVYIIYRFNSISTHSCPAICSCTINISFLFKVPRKGKAKEKELAISAGTPAASSSSSTGSSGKTRQLSEWEKEKQQLYTQLAEQEGMNKIHYYLTSKLTELSNESRASQAKLDKEKQKSLNLEAQLESASKPAKTEDHNKKVMLHSTVIIPKLAC